MAKGVRPRDIDAFSEAYAKYTNGGCGQRKAAEISGMSLPTFLKYANMVFKGEKLPDNLFKIEDGKNKK